MHGGYADGFRNGAASRDTEVSELRQQLADLNSSYVGVTERIHMVGGYLDQIKVLQADNKRLREAVEYAILIIGHPEDSGTVYLKEALAKVRKPT